MEKSGIGIVTKNLENNLLLVSYAVDFNHAVRVMSKATDVTFPPGCCLVTGDAGSAKELLAFGRSCSVLIIEDISADTMALRQLRREGVNIYPQPEVIDIIRNRCLLKKILGQASVPVANARGVSGRNDIHNYAAMLPSYLKRCDRNDDRDGEGICLVQDIDELPHITDGHYILEAPVPVKQEFTVLISRNEAGVVECYSPLWMAFDEEQVFMDFKLCPDTIEPEQAMEAGQIALKVVNNLNVTGFLAIEMFVTEHEKIVVNDVKLASGYPLQEDAPCSGFERKARRLLRLIPDEAPITPESLTSDLIEPEAARRDCIAQALRSIFCLPGSILNKTRRARVLDTPLEPRLLRAVMIRHILSSKTQQANAVHVL